MRKGENSPAFLSPPGHFFHLYDGPSVPCLSWLPDASASGAGDPEAVPSTKHRYDKSFCCDIKCAYAQYILQLNKVLMVMGKSQVISEIKWCQECELRKLGQIETDAALISVGKS